MVSLHIASILLWRRMFENGLAIRGVLHAGEFYVENSCFAGKAIVEAYDFEQDLELSACIYSEKAFDEILELSKEYEHLRSILITNAIPYLVPRKRIDSKRIRVINPLSLSIDTSPLYIQKDIQQFVHESFWKHDKDITESAKNKLTNTIQFLRICLSLIPPPLGTGALSNQLGKWHSDLNNQ